MRYKAHEYQEYATEYILSHPIAAVLLQMGLGKTVITLSAIVDLLFDYFKIRKVLIIAPLRVAQMTWSDEIKKWDHLGILQYSIVVGTPVQRRKALDAKADIYITNRENVQWLCENYPSFFSEDTMIVIDELSSFKSIQAKRFKALMKQRPKVSRVVGLTGSPSSNGLIDLFAEYKLLDMGVRLGRFKGRYVESYFKPDKMNGPIVYSYKPQEGAEEAIYEKISDITISMKASDHIKMPELINTQYEVCLSDDEMNVYKGLKEELVIDLPNGEVTASNAAALSGKLSQMANGAVYADDEVLHIHDRKLDALEDIIEAMNGNSLLVSYWYRHDYERITRRLTEKGIPFETLTTEEAIRKWNEGRVLVGLIHPASAGHGLNLQKGGNTLVWFGLTWSLELYQQTIARLWRQGQEAGTVVVQHIITKDTIDERIMRALSKKDNTQMALIDAVKAEIRFGTVRA
ncbi:MAG: DEAD/DEAH box helicase [Lachnospiraceae bacterium]|nr:DEAD/DEAH box helicase [Lachnospiraceae bacterium]